MAPRSIRPGNAGKSPIPRRPVKVVSLCIHEHLMPASTSSAVLVVDDNPTVRQLVQIVLERSGRDVFLAQDGIEASLLLERQSFDLVVTDLEMPRRTGLEVIADVRRLSPATRVIAMSGEWVVSGTDLRHMASGLGVRAFLKKPFTPRQLLDLVGSADTAPELPRACGPAILSAAAR